MRLPGVDTRQRDATSEASVSGTSRGESPASPGTTRGGNPGGWPDRARLPDRWKPGRDVSTRRRSQEPQLQPVSGRPHVRHHPAPRGNLQEGHLASRPAPPCSATGGCEPPRETSAGQGALLRESGATCIRRLSWEESGAASGGNRRVARQP